MPLQWKIRELMGARETKTRQRETYQKIYEATGISPNTLSKLSKGKAELVGVVTLERLLEYFECEPNDLMALYKED